MKKAWIALIAVALLAMPAGAVAHGKGQDVKNAARYCKQLRTQMGADAFRQAYAGKKSAFGKCVKQRVHELRAAHKAAVRSCKQQFKAEGRKFRRHGNQENRAAFKQCVKEKTQAETGDDQQGVLNAAKVCAAERDKDPAAFTDRYGSNHNKRNAFGKCVSQHSDDGQNETEPGDGGNTGTEPGNDNGGDTTRV